MINNYQCQCKPGYHGRQCEVRTDFCQRSPCLNGGVCNNNLEGAQCLCPHGYFGANCQYSGMSCDSSPCQVRIH